MHHDEFALSVFSRLFILFGANSMWVSQYQTKFYSDSGSEATHAWVSPWFLPGCEGANRWLRWLTWDNIAGVASTCVAFGYGMARSIMPDQVCAHMLPARGRMTAPLNQLRGDSSIVQQPLKQTGFGGVGRCPVELPHPIYTHSSEGKWILLIWTQWLPETQYQWCCTSTLPLFDISKVYTYSLHVLTCWHTDHCRD